MTTINNESIQKFISCNYLKKENGIILFDAAVVFYKDHISHTVNSQVQIIVLPNAIAVYIFEFLKEEYNRTEMYSTVQYHFNLSGASTLKISADNSEDPFVAVILPI